MCSETRDSTKHIPVPYTVITVETFIKYKMVLLGFAFESIYLTN